MRRCPRAPPAADPVRPRRADRGRTRGGCPGQAQERADRQPRCPQSIGRTAYRMIQEGLTNARKHAPNTDVVVIVRRPGDGLSVEVRNPIRVGSGRAHAGARSGFGLVGLTERAPWPMGGSSTGTPPTATSSSAPGYRGSVTAESQPHRPDPGGHRRRRSVGPCRPRHDPGWHRDHRDRRRRQATAPPGSPWLTSSCPTSC